MYRCHISNLFFLLLFHGAIVQPLLHSQEAFDVRSAYAKREVLIPMRDGVRLFTSIYTPRDTTRPYPIIMIRTPYSVAPYGEDKYPRFLRPSISLMKEGFIFVYQDVRGCYMSEGSWVELRPINPSRHSTKDIDESTDTYDTVDWLVKNVPHNNGRVGITGISYPGFYATMGTIGAHPAVKAASPQAPIADDFIGDDDHHNGAFFLTAAFDFYAQFGWPRPVPTQTRDRSIDYGTNDGYSFFLNLGALPHANERYFHGEVSYWNDLMNHGTYDGYWKKLNVLPHLKQIKPTVMIVGGWFDAEDLYGPLKTYAAIKKQDPGASVALVMGPWSHGQWSSPNGDHLGPIEFGSNTSDYFQKNIELPFYNARLKNRGDYRPPAVTVFLTGANEWHAFESWPPGNAHRRSLYTREDGRLSFDPPGANEKPFDEFVSDPAKPVPYTKQITFGFPREYMDEDQRFVSGRTDVLVYQTPPLDKDVTLAGPIIPHLVVSTSGTDADWVVKVIDVFPDTSSNDRPLPSAALLAGYQMLLRGDVMRGKFRTGLSTPSPFTPGKPTLVEFELRDVFHRFLKGHRIMVQIQSSWFPLVDRNPGVFEDIYRASDADFRPTRQRVYHTPGRVTSLKISVLE